MLGAAIVSVAYFVTTSGGSVVGGESQKDNDITANGGVETGGLADLECRYVEIVGGGASVAGQFSVFTIATINSSGGCIGASSALPASVLEPILAGGTLALGQSPVVTVANLSSNGGSIAASVASVGSVFRPVLAGGLVAKGGAVVQGGNDLTVSHGAVAAGTAEIMIVFGQNLSGSGVKANGFASLNSATVPLKVLAYHRFSIGEKVFVLSWANRQFMQKRVRGVTLSGTTVLYDFGAEKLVPEQFVLSTEEYRAEVRGEALSRFRRTVGTLSKLRASP
jgi:hypothetical protein